MSVARRGPERPPGAPERRVPEPTRLAPAPRIHRDSPALATRCYKDTFAPDVAALLTFEGDAQEAKRDLASLP